MARHLMGSYIKTAQTEINLIEEFKKVEIAKTPQRNIFNVKQIAIEAPAGTSLTINDTDLKMPQTGILEFGYDMIELNNLVFHKAVPVNIIYLF